MQVRGLPLNPPMPGGEHFEVGILREKLAVIRVDAEASVPEGGVTAVSSGISAPSVTATWPAEGSAELTGGR